MNNSARRRLPAVVVAVLATLALLCLGTVAATGASADTAYPPTSVCSSPAGSVNSDDACGSDVVDQRGTRGGADENTGSNETGTASTGFATLTASVIAAVLLVGGAGLVVAGRRRRHG